MVIKLGNTPKTFKKSVVKFRMPDGSNGVINAVFKYRTRTQFGEFLNTVFADAGEKAPEGETPDFEKLFAATKDKNADHLILALDSWDVDAELTLDSLKLLSNEIPAASIALMEAYNNACTQGKLGN